MKKTMLILKTELINVVTRRSFLITLFLLPIIGMIIILVISAFQKSSGADPTDLLKDLMAPQAESSMEGYIDQSGLVNIVPPGYESQLTGFVNEVSAKEALQQGKITAYYIIRADYLESGNVDYVRPDF